MKIPGILDKSSAPPPGTLAVLGLVLAAVLVQFGMHVAMIAKKGDLRDFAAGYTAAVVARTGATFYDPQPGNPWFGANVNVDLMAAARSTFWRIPFEKPTSVAWRSVSSENSRRNRSGRSPLPNCAY